jgi:hypothetical protein
MGARQEHARRIALIFFCIPFCVVGGGAIFFQERPCKETVDTFTFRRRLNCVLKYRTLRLVLHGKDPKESGCGQE